MMSFCKTLYNYVLLAKQLNKIKNSYPTIQINDIDVLFTKINQCGAVCIKFSQWVLPIIDNYYLVDDKKPEWFNHLEQIYDKCLTHRDEYTKKIYNSDYQEYDGIEFDEKYEIVEIIASGSIGQVYKIRDLVTKEIYAMKVVHPEVRTQINHFKTILKLLSFLPSYKRLLRKYLPIDLNGFIDEFHIQTNMIQEANNMQRFYYYYKDCKKYIIPLAISFSKNILIMEYNEGTKLDDLDVTEYRKRNIISYFLLHGRNNEKINIVHGDIHKGNWCVKEIENGDNVEYSIIIYDFGITFNFNYSEMYIYDLALDIFQNSDESCEDIEQIVTFLKFFLDIKDKQKEKMMHEYLKEQTKLNDKFLKLDPVKFFKILLDLARETNHPLNIHVIRYVIILIQLVKYYDKYYRPDGEDIVKDVFRNRLTENYTLCKTDNICPYYMKYLENELNKKNETVDELFSFASTDISNNLDLLREIKKNM